MRVILENRGLNIVFKIGIFFTAFLLSFVFISVENITAQSNPDVLICIDPGHGGRDPGATGPTGLTEKEVNLDIALRLRNKLQNAGYKVIMTRDNDSYVSLEERVRIANTKGANLFISIHNNAWFFPTANGTETYYCLYSPSMSKDFASLIHNETLNQINTRNRGVKTANFYVLKNTSMISALIEGAFISNTDEEGKLRDAQFRDKIATGIYNGITKFLSGYDLVPYRASIDDLGNTPLSLISMETKTFNIKVTNNSQSFTWTSTGTNKVDISYHIYDKYENIVIYDGLRSPLPEDVSPGETVTLPITIKSPDTTGEYILEYDIVHEGVTWFSSWGNATLRKNFKVVGSQLLTNFITRLYQQCLNRDPDPGGLSGWVNYLVNGTLTGAEVAYNFIFSQEFITRNLNNEEFLNVMYKAFFGREPDTDGYNGWLNELNNNKTREYVLAGFLNSQEFKNLCNSYGINPGSLTVDNPVDTTALVSNFITRLYQQCLNRDPDPGGLSGWVNYLVNGTLTGAEVAYNFIFSQEFITRNLNNEEFLNVMYKAFFGREPDTDGYNGWLNELNNNKTREYVLAGFLNSQEYKNLCNSYGINPGKVEVPLEQNNISEDTVNSEDITNDYDISMVEGFIKHLYIECLGREPDLDSLNGWVNYLITGQLSGADVAYGFIFSQEFIARNLNNEEFLNVMYKAFFDRKPDTDGYNGWLNELNNNKTREYVLAGFLNSQEYKNLCNSYGINPGKVEVPLEQYNISEDTVNNKDIANNYDISMVEGFVKHLYIECLGREPDLDSLNKWSDKIVYSNLAASQLAYSIIFSEEFISRSVTNSEFVTIMYRAFFNREPDKKGYEDWLKYLSDGKSREFVLAGFVNSTEFHNFCKDYGVNP